MMRIAILGYYHAMNVGDDRIMQCWTRVLEGHQCSFFRHHEPPSLSCLRTFDIILIGGGGLVWDHIGVWKDVQNWTQKCPVPIGVAGLGVNEVPDLLEPELKALVDRCWIFHVRDQKSHRLLGHPEQVQVSPDLSWMFPFAQRLDKTTSTTVAVNLCKRVGISPRQAMSVFKNIDMSPFPLHMATGEDADYLDEMFQVTVNREFDIQTLALAESAVLCRYHAIQFAVQLGVPFLAVIYDDKVTRFLNDHKLHDLAVDPNEFDSLTERLRWLKTNRESIVNRISHVRQRLVAEGISLRDHLREECASIAKTPPTKALRIRRRIDRWCAKW